MSLANHRTVFTTASGHHIDLLNPKASQINFADIAEHLAKIGRYYGSTPGRVYSVAEHCVRGSEAIFAATQSPYNAAYFVLHDGHEFIRGDEATPKKIADEEIARHLEGEAGYRVIRRVREMGERLLDNAIHDAAGLPFPPPPLVRDQVKRFDLIMRETEWRDLVPGIMPPWPPIAGVQPLHTAIVEPHQQCWTWQDAKAAYLEACERWLPVFGKVRLQ